MEKEQLSTGFDLFNHPLRWLDYFGIPSPYPWQIEVINEAAKHFSRCSVSSANGAGKTNIVIPLLGLAVMTVFPGATVFSTAGVEEQIRGQLFKYLEAKLRPYIKFGWSVSINDLVVNGPEVDGLRSRWIARVPKDAMTMQGYHGHLEKNEHGETVWCPVMVIIDEAHAVGSDIYESAWRIEPDWFLAISTPGNDYGPFFDSMEDIVKSGKSGAVHKDKHGLWTYRRRIADTECPHLMTSEKIDLKNALVKKYGENSTFIKSKYGGEFKRPTDENYIFKDYEINLVRRAMTSDVVVTHGEKRGALDFSAGGDEQVIGIVDGNEVTMKAFREEDTAKLSRIFVDRLRKEDVLPQNVNADNGGLGVGVLDAIEDENNLNYRPIARYMNNQAAVNRFEYADRITEDHYRFIDILHRNPLKLPDDPILLKQIRQRRFTIDDHHKVKLEHKRDHRRRTGESPDRLDTLVMLFSEWNPPRPKVDVEPEHKSKLEAQAVVRSGAGGGAFGWMKDHKQPELSGTIIKEMAKTRR